MTHGLANTHNDDHVKVIQLNITAQINPLFLISY